jgi:hypothetical protein
MLPRLRADSGPCADGLTGLVVGPALAPGLPSAARWLIDLDDISNKTFITIDISSILHSSDGDLYCFVRAESVKCRASASLDPRK